MEIGYMPIGSVDIAHGLTQRTLPIKNAHRLSGICPVTQWKLPMDSLKNELPMDSRNNAHGHGHFQCAQLTFTINSGDISNGLCGQYP